MRTSIHAVVTAIAATSLMAGVMPQYATGAARPTCFGRSATIVGTNGADHIHGTPRADVIVGRGGLDAIRGLGGDDRICALQPIAVFGGTGADMILDQRGAVTRRVGALRGGFGNDLVISPDNLAAHGGAGDDSIRATGPQLSYGGAGNDRMSGDSADGGPGHDTIRAGTAWFTTARRYVFVNLHAGFALGEGHDTLIHVEDVFGSIYADVIKGDKADNRLVGVAGVDALYGRAGSDDLDLRKGLAHGGRGRDFCELVAFHVSCRTDVQD